MHSTLKISVLRPGKQPLKTEGLSIQIPSYDGLIGIQPGRQPLLSILNAGIISITSGDGQKNYFATSGGFAEVHNDVVTLLCDSIITTKEIQNIPSDNKENQIFFTKDVSTMTEEEKYEYLVEMLRYKIEEE